MLDASVDDVLSTTNDPSFLNLSSRNVTTTVTVEPGETLLLGGLLQSQLTVTRNRLPIIGSIPLIGDLFGRTVTENGRTIGTDGSHRGSASGVARGHPVLQGRYRDGAVYMTSPCEAR